MFSTVIMKVVLIQLNAGDIFPDRFLLRSLLISASDSFFIFYVTTFWKSAPSIHKNNFVLLPK
jgi:hypothetical protein